jgi:hypothetical protein
VIKFEFTMSDIDAENMFFCIHDHICNMKCKRLDFIADGDNASANWMVAHIAYLETLMPQMLNKRVD